PEAVLGPLIQWALFSVQIAAKDILAAHAELAGYQHASLSSDVLTSPSTRLEMWIADRRATGRGLPASAPRYDVFHKGPDSALHRVNCVLVGRMAGVGNMTNRCLRPILERAAETMDLEPGGMDTPISCHPTTGRPWRDRFSPHTLRHETSMLVAACYIV